MAQLERKFSGAPFGTQTPRFDVAGVHPASKMPASYTQVSDFAVVTYVVYVT